MSLLTPIARKPSAQTTVPSEQSLETLKVSRFVTEEKSLLTIPPSDLNLADFDLEEGLSLKEPEDTIPRPQNPEPDPSKLVAAEPLKKTESELRRLALSNIKKQIA